MEERIDDYIQGKMSIEDRTAFEKLIAENADLAILVSNYPAAEDVAELSLEMQLLKEVEEVQATSKATVETVPNTAKARFLFKGMNKYLWKAALFLVVALLILFWLLGNRKNEKRQQYFADNYELPRDLDVKRNVADLTLLTEYEKAKHYFSLNDWKNSEQQWNMVLKSSTDQDTLSTAHYYLGHIYLNQYEFAKAKAAFMQSQRPEVAKYLSLIAELENM